MNHSRIAVVSLALSSGLAAAKADLPIREVTVFKDGHAMVLRSGVAATNAAGDVVLDELPLPVLGTFWAFEDTEAAGLRSVRAGRVDEATQVEPGSIQDLLMLAVGEDVVLRIGSDTEIRGRLTKIVGGTGGTALVAGDDGLVAVPMGQIQRVTFADPAVADRKREEVRHAERLTIDLGWDGAPAAEARVGMAYIQKGLRWIPSYRVTLLDDDTARVELQATLVNELADLHDVSMHLVVGVPTFAFEHTLDPIGLQDQIADLGQYFRRADQSGNMFSNAIMTQSARMAETRDFMPAGGPGGPPDVEVGGTESQEDLYVFHVDHVTLARGERLVVPIAVTEVPYEPVYTLDIPIAPPTETWQYFNTDQQRQIAQMLAQPKATHVLRMTNTSEHPFTTAPALVIREGRPLAQNLMRYTAKNAKVDLEVTKAVDIRIESSSKETGRDARALDWNGHTYARIDLAGLTEITNYKDNAIKLEVTRYVLGLADGASHDGEASQIDFFTDLDWSDPTFQWYRWYGWPWWWSRLNGAAKFEWDLEMKPGERVELESKWHYMWG